MPTRSRIGILLLLPAILLPKTLCANLPSRHANAAASNERRSTPAIADLEAEIRRLRTQGQYADAIAIAQAVLERLAVEQNDSPFAIEDARNALVTLTRIAGLSEIERCELQDADAAAASGLTSIEKTDLQVEVRSRLLGARHFETLTWLMESAIVRLNHRLVSDAELMYRRSLEGFLATVGEDHPSTLRNRSHLARVSHFQGDFAEAERLFRLVVESRRRVYGEEHDDTRTAEVNLARMLYELGRYQESGDLYHVLFEWSRNRFGEAHYITLACMGGLGCSLRATGDLETAEGLLRRRIEIDREHQYGQTNDIDALYALTLILREKGELRNAERVCREALEVHERIKHVEDPKLLDILNAFAELIQAQGRFAEAESMWRRSAASYENVRGLVSYSGFQRVRFAADASPYLRFAACLARNGKPEAAWRQMERGLARGLSDVVQGAASRTPASMTAGEQSERSRLQTALARSDEVVAVCQSQSPIDAIALCNARRELNIRRADVVAFEKRMAERHGIPAAQPYEIGRIQDRMPDDTAFIAWIDFPATPGSPDPGGDHWACILRRHGTPDWIRLPGSGSDRSWTEQDESLASVVARKIAQWPTERLNLDEDIAALTIQRIDPVVATLPNIRHLIVLPVGPMSHVPIQVLTNRYTVSYAPSATLSAWLCEVTDQGERRHRRRSLLALGNPRYDDAAGAGLESIPGSGYEAKAIARLFASIATPPKGQRNGAPSRDHTALTLLLDDDATESSLQSLAESDQLRQYSHIHISAHGILDDVAPWRSALILTEPRRPVAPSHALHETPICDGRLTAAQIVRTWRLDADLVTLSGCETGLGKAQGGEGLVGFSQALFASGARSLILSLWKVDDVATALLMHRLYENLTGAYSGERRIAGATYTGASPMPKAVALFEAKQWLRTNSPLQNQMALRNLGFDMQEVNTALASARSGIRMTDEQPQTQFDYSDPHYWAAFVLSGNPN